MFFNTTWIKCAVIAICDLSGFPLLEGMIHPNALLESNIKRLIRFKMHKIFCRLKTYCDIKQRSPDFSDLRIVSCQGIGLCYPRI